MLKYCSEREIDGAVHKKNQPGISEVRFGLKTIELLNTT